MDTFLLNVLLLPFNVLNPVEKLLVVAPLVLFDTD